MAKPETLELLLQRFKKTEKSVQGSFYIKGQTDRLFYTLERPWGGGANSKDNPATQDVNESTCVLPGRYRLELYLSPSFKRELPRLLGTPGRDFCLIHPANWPYQLKGCIAPGLAMGVDSVQNSDLAMSKLMPLIRNAVLANKEIWLTIENKW